MARTKKRLAKEWFPGDKRGEKPEDITNYKSKDLSYFKPEDLRKILTEQEIIVLKMAAKGMTNKQIADALYLSIRTVQGHINGIFHKLGVGSRTEAIFQSVKRGLLSFDDVT